MERVYELIELERRIEKLKRKAAKLKGKLNTNERTWYEVHMATPIDTGWLKQSTAGKPNAQ